MTLPDHTTSIGKNEKYNLSSDKLELIFPIQN